jgi:hypothetical protein
LFEPVQGDFHETKLTYGKIFKPIAAAHFRILKSVGTNPFAPCESAMAMGAVQSRDKEAKRDNHNVKILPTDCQTNLCGLASQFHC